MRMRSTPVTGLMHPSLRCEAEAAISPDIILAMCPRTKACHRIDN